MLLDAVRLVDKAPGETSHDVVNRVRRELREHAGVPASRKTGHPVGHAGTLDPFATGLLLVLTGRATRVQPWLMGQRKNYLATARFGWRSSTGDPEGELEHTGVEPQRPLVLPTGRLRQRPPIYSAVKVAGVPAYRRVRRGEDVELAEREVEVFRFEEVEPDTFAIECSSGTYVRSLIADLGDAYCTSLRRTAIGPFSVEDAGTVLPLGDALAQVLPVVELEADRARRLTHGQTLALPEAPEDGDVLVRDPDGPVAIAARKGAEHRAVVGFRSA